MKGKLILSVEEAADQEKWLAIRKQGIGGSDVTAIVGLNSYKSAYELWTVKTGRAEEEDLSDNEYVYWGSANEPNIAIRFQQVTGKKVRRCGTLEDEEYPFFHANIDRWIVGENAGLEIKTAGLTKSREWKDDQLPDDYYCQCQWYMGVTGAEKWYIACLIGGNKMVWKEIQRNEKFITDIRQFALDFWTKNVQGDVPPEIDGSESTSKVINKEFPTSNGVEVALPSIMQELLDEYDQQCRLEAMIAECKESIVNKIKVIMGDNEIGLFKERKITWKTQAGRVTIDSKKLQKEHPDAYAACMKVGKPSRIFRVK